MLAIRRNFRDREVVSRTGGLAAIADEGASGAGSFGIGGASEIGGASTAIRSVGMIPVAFEGGDSTIGLWAGTTVRVEGVTIRWILEGFPEPRAARLSCGSSEGLGGSMGE